MRIDDISKNRITPEDFIALIEIPKGTKNKYEIDKETGLICLDRVLFTSTHYPANYGLIPRTLAKDGDHLDVLVLCSEPIISYSLVRCYPVGMIVMTDQNENDEKIIAIPFSDPEYNTYRSIDEVPAHKLNEMHHFFSVYKQLENKPTAVHEVLCAEDAKRTIADCMRRFEKHNQ